MEVLDIVSMQRDLGMTLDWGFWWEQRGKQVQLVEELCPFYMDRVDLVTYNPGEGSQMVRNRSYD